MRVCVIMRKRERSSRVVGFPRCFLPYSFLDCLLFDEQVGERCVCFFDVEYVYIYTFFFFFFKWINGYLADFVYVTIRGRRCAQKRRLIFVLTT